MTFEYKGKEYSIPKEYKKGTLEDSQCRCKHPDRPILKLERIRWYDQTCTEIHCAGCIYNWSNAEARKAYDRVQRLKEIKDERIIRS